VTVDLLAIVLAFRTGWFEDDRGERTVAENVTGEIHGRGRSLRWRRSTTEPGLGKNQYDILNTTE
jgi:hypothetical protein